MRKISLRPTSILLPSVFLPVVLSFATRTLGADKPQPPVVTCHAGNGLFCAFTFHKENQAEQVNLRLDSAQYQVMDESLIGAPYCVAVGKEKVPQPRWPYCLSEPNNVWTNDVFHKVGVVRPGNVND